MDILDFYSSSSGKGVGAFRSLPAVEASLIEVSVFFCLHYGFASSSSFGHDTIF
jgi:hypothetical protein